MRKADDQDLRDALSQEVESLEPSDELWRQIHRRSVAKLEKRPNPWLRGALAIGAAAAAAIFLFTGPLRPGPGPEAPAGEGPRTMIAPKGTTTLPAVPGPGDSPSLAPSPEADRPFVRYNHTMYWYNGETIPAAQVGALLTLTTREPQPNGYSNAVEAGKAIRSIKGSDPIHRIAVQTDQGWQVFDNMLKPLPPKDPSK